MPTIAETLHATPVAGQSDVVVCGGGPAGVAAAIAAARAGARTTLLERNGCLGGIWTAGLVAWVIDSSNKGGIMTELRDELQAGGAAFHRVPGGPNFAFDVEAMKLLLERKCVDAGVDVRLHTHVAGGVAAGARVTHAITESKSGRQAWAAQAFVDATGDGDFAAQCGCGFDEGDPETGRAQPMSFCALLAGLDFRDVEPFVGGGMKAPKQRLLAEMQRAGMTPSYTPPVLLRVSEGLFVLIANHEYNVSARDAGAISQATLHGRQEVHQLVAGLRSLGGFWKDLRVVATAEQIGVREGRRVHGRYTVTMDDILRGACHEDAACRVTAGLDIHSTDPARSTGFDAPPAPAGRTLRAQPYDIPLRALMARDVDGLWLAGRCISGDFFAHSSYRMTGNAVATGQAAGRAAAGGAAQHGLQLGAGA